MCTNSHKMLCTLTKMHKEMCFTPMECVYHTVHTFIHTNGCNTYWVVFILRHECKCTLNILISSPHNLTHSLKAKRYWTNLISHPVKLIHTWAVETFVSVKQDNLLWFLLVGSIIYVYACCLNGSYFPLKSLFIMLANVSCTKTCMFYMNICECNFACS